jgi:hypothetical protein
MAALGEAGICDYPGIEPKPLAANKKLNLFSVCLAKADKLPGWSLQ